MDTKSSFISLQSIPLPGCIQKIVYDKNRKGCNAIFTEVNPAFEKIIGKNRNEIIGKLETEVLRGEEFEPLRWFKEYGEIARGKGDIEKEVYFPPLKTWTRFIAFSHKKGFVTTLVHDISEQKNTLHKLVDISESFLQLQDQPIDYQQIADLMLELSGARYVLLNLRDEDLNYITKSLSGPSDKIKKALSILGYELVDKVWPHDPVRDSRIMKEKITSYKSLNDLADNSLPPVIIRTLEKLLNLGEVKVARISRGDRIIGDFTFIMDKGADFRNQNEIEIFSRKVGILLIQLEAEKNLWEKESKYRGIFESIQDVYFETDLNGKILEVSPSISHLSKGQYTRDNVLGTNLQDYYRDNNERIRLIRALRHKKKVNDYEVVLQNRDGNSAHCSISASMVFCQSRRLFKITGILRDVSQRINAENALKVSEERFRKLSEASAAAVMVSQGNNFYFVNRAATLISGYSEKELLNMNIIDLAHPEQRFILKERASRRKKGLPNSKRFEIKILHKAGYARWIDITNEETEFEGKPAVVATAFDITERKQTEEALRESEERFRSLTDNAFEGIYLIQDNKYQYVNDRFCEITGCQRKTLLTDDFNYETLISEKSIRDLRQRYNDRKAGKDVPKTYELEVKNSNGGYKNVEVSTVKIIQGEKPFYIGIMRDITERKSNERLREKVTIAEQAARFKQNFLANMSHEMRTPMNGIIGMTSVLAKSNLTTDQRNFVKVIEESSKSLLNLINDVLHLSKIEAGKVQLEKNTIETSKLLQKIELLHKETAQQKGLEISCMASSNFPEFFIADEGRISQVINNLIANAIKFTSKGYIRLYCHQLENYHGNLTLQISVADTGRGIPQDKHQFIFEEFSQIDTSRTRNQEGTGLGLAISKRVTEMLGGKIQVKSHPGKGSTFWFSFKAQKTFAGLNGGGKQAIQDETTVKLNLSVLVVEDKLVNRLVAELMLKDLGCRVDIAENGLIAIEKIIRKKYDAVLMDIQMPVMDGITAVKELRKLKIKLPAIIGLSAEAMEGDAERYISQGMDDYLTKPLDQNLLATKLIEHTSP